MDNFSVYVAAWIAVVCVGVLTPLAAEYLFPRRPLPEPHLAGETVYFEVRGWRVATRYWQGRYYSPFLNRDGMNFASPTESGIKRSIASCLEKDKFRDQRDKLERQGIITRLPEAAERSRS